VKAATKAHLDNAEAALRRARACVALLEQEPLIAESIGREAYYAAFHAAKSLLYERRGAQSKRHGSVHREFAAITVEDASIDQTLSRFLVHAYELKLIGDYSTDPSKQVTATVALDALATATRFVEAITALLPPDFSG
jgi:uncharacterized protein (UPF0332 family)